MKSIYRIFMLLFAAILITSCGGSEDDPSSSETIADKIVGNWTIDPTSNNLSSITLDGLDVSSLFNEFSLTINSDLSYTTNSNLLTIDSFPWPQTGSFSVNDSGTIMTRDDGLEIASTFNSDYTLMTLMFTYSSQYDNAGGRVHGVSGLWEFTMVKK